MSDTYDEQTEIYRTALDSGMVTYVHCAHCMNDRPPGVSPSEWRQLEAVVIGDALVVGCARCNLPIIGSQLPGNVPTDCAHCGDHHVH